MSVNQTCNPVFIRIKPESFNGCTSWNQNYWSLAADFSTGLTVTAQLYGSVCSRGLACNIQYVKNQAGIVSSSLFRLSSSCHNEHLHSQKGFIILNVYWVSSSFQTSNRTLIYDPLLEKWSTHSIFYHWRKCLTPVLLYLYKCQVRPQMEYCSHAIAGGYLMPTLQTGLCSKSFMLSCEIKLILHTVVSSS